MTFCNILGHKWRASWMAGIICHRYCFTFFRTTSYKPLSLPGTMVVLSSLQFWAAPFHSWKWNMLSCRMLPGKGLIQDSFNFQAPSTKPSSHEKNHCCVTCPQVRYIWAEFSVLMALGYYGQKCLPLSNIVALWPIRFFHKIKIKRNVIFV